MEEDFPGRWTIIILALVSTVPISMVFQGSLHIHDCPMQPMVPKYLVVAGFFGLLRILLSMCVYQSERHENMKTMKLFDAFASLITFFNLCWNIAGSVVFFSKWKIWKNVISTNGLCHKNTYLFGFALLIIFWITLPCQLTVSYINWKRNHESSYEIERFKV